MATIYIPPEDIKKGKNIRLNPEKSRYLGTVLRGKLKDRIEVIDGMGKIYEAEIISIIKGSIFVDIIAEIPSECGSAWRLVLCQGILKGEKMDMVIQKAAELGISEIVPLITERCIIKETRKTKRWRKIAEESAEQCGSALIPAIHEPVKFIDFFCQPLKGFVFWEEGGIPLSEAIKRISDSIPDLSTTAIHILIGPEGGFPYEEVMLAEKNGLIRTSLCRRILRAETAAIVSAALIQYLLEPK